MCGFIGFISDINDNQISNYEEKFQYYLSQLNNRGPDYTETKKIIFKNKIIQVGFSRLAIQDLNSNSNKIFFNEDAILLFNGDLNKFPVDEESKLYPKNIYGLSKKMNEEYILINSNKNTKYIGLRFFTVFGEWGRPDMLILKFLKSVKDNKTFYLNNMGKHWRDFTYIDDVVENLLKLLNKKFKKNLILNVCSNRPVYIKDLIKYLSKKSQFFKIKNVKKNNFEVLKTHGKNKKLIEITKFKKFSNFYESVDKTIAWFDKYYHLI